MDLTNQWSRRTRAKILRNDFNYVTWRNIQPVKVTSTDDDGKATGKSFREQMKEKCIEYMDQGTEWRFLLVNQSQPFCFLAYQNPLILSKRDRNVCHLFEWIFCWRNWTAKNMENFSITIILECFSKIVQNCHPMKTCARGPALLVTGEWDSMFNTVGNSGEVSNWSSVSDWTELPSNQHQLETPSQQWQSCQVLD